MRTRLGWMVVEISSDDDLGEMSIAASPETSSVQGRIQGGGHGGQLTPPSATA